MDINILCKGIVNNICYLKKSPRNHNNVGTFQKELAKWLNDLSNGAAHYTWEEEKIKATRVEGDKIDIYGKIKNGTGPEWIIEIDATRADQVAKKMLSRFTLWGLVKGEPITYVAILYADTQEGRRQSKKFIRYGDAILRKINSKSRVFGIILGKECPNKKQYVDEDYIEIIDPRTNNQFIVGNSVVKGMPNCAKKAIKMYADSKKIKTYTELERKFGRYISDSRGASRYKPTGLVLDTKEVHTYSQFRHFSNWQDFKEKCKELDVRITELDCWYTQKGFQYSDTPIKY